MVTAGPVIRLVTRYGIKYGPVVYELVKYGREPAQEAVRRAIERRSANRVANDHARTVRNPSVLRVVHQGQPTWVVFSGEEPVAAYPSTAAPLHDLVAHADLDQRTPPTEPVTRRPSLPNVPNLPNLVNLARRQAPPVE
jgi:hypothetical protein